MSEQVPPSSHRLREMAFDYENAVSEARSEQIAARAAARARTISPASRRFASVLGGVSVLFVVVFALGAISANSLPGDPLYGVSRTYESVGDWAGVVDPVEQRLHEVIALADRGDVELATQAAEEALVYLEQTTDIELVISASPATTVPRGGDEASGPSAKTPANVTVEQVNTLRLAAQLLLQSVQNNGDTLEAAAVELAEAVSDVAVQTTTDPVPETTSRTTVPTSPTSTTTTLVEETTTTMPDSTTTTISEEGDGDDGEGPIFIPPGF